MGACSTFSSSPPTSLLEAIFGKEIVLKLCEKFQFLSSPLSKGTGNVDRSIHSWLCVINISFNELAILNWKFLQMIYIKLAVAARMLVIMTKLLTVLRCFETSTDFVLCHIIQEILHFAGKRSVDVCLIALQIEPHHVVRFFAFIPFLHADGKVRRKAARPNFFK